jgi:Glycosyl hydrolase family 76
MRASIRQSMAVALVGLATAIAVSPAAQARGTAAIGAHATQARGGPPPSFAQAASRGMAELLGSGDHSPVGWNYKTGLWGGQVPANWWQSALAVQALVRYAELTRENPLLYQRILVRVYKRNIYKPHSTARREFANQFMDDTGWWALAWLAASRYELDYRGDRTDAAKFLGVAEWDARYIASQPKWCGGIEWSIGRPPDTISNAEFATLTAELYAYRNTRGPFYNPAEASAWLNDANATLSWLQQSGLVNMKSGSVDDGLDGSCHVIGGAITYTEGETAEALVQLGNALGDPSYYDEAEAFLQYTISPASELTGNGILEERCEGIFGGCDHLHFRRDLPAYKGVFIDAVSDWAAATHSDAFGPFLEAQATAVVDNAVRGPNSDPARCVTPHTCQFAFHWNGERDPLPIGVTLGGQESALDALMAVLPSQS